MSKPEDSFYDSLTPFYDLIYPNWSATVDKQGAQLAEIITSEWPHASKVLDVSCGIGTQIIGLAKQGFNATGSDICGAVVDRAMQEASHRNLTIALSVADMRNAAAHHGSHFDAVISADNSIAHLPTDEAISSALLQMHDCLLPGGGCVITLRDYAAEARGTNIFKPYGVRVRDSKRYVIYQVWDFDGDHYEMTFCFVEENQSTGEFSTHAMRTRLYAVSVSKVLALMQDAGFEYVRRLDNAFFQPVLVGTRV